MALCRTNRRIHRSGSAIIIALVGLTVTMMLGLAVVKAFIEMHGGQVQVTSDVGRGTTFTIVLPPLVPPLAA